MGKVTKIVLHLAALAVLGGGLTVVLRPEVLGVNQVAVGTSAVGPSELQEIQGADVANSPYFPAVDIFNMVSGGDKLVLPHFKTRQQRTQYTCGPVAAMMVVDYYLGECPDGELEVAKVMGTRIGTGTTIGGMAKYFEKLGWDITSSATKAAPKTYDDFIPWVKQNLQRKNPIIVENVDWGGHYRVIMGYDGMGTATTGDDVLFLADPYDTSDHRRDGYNIVSAERFYYSWFDHQLFPKNEQERPYIIGKPK